MVVEYIKTDAEKLRQWLEALDYRVLVAGINFVAIHNSDPGLASIKVKGKGDNLDPNIPTVNNFTGPLDVQLQKSSGGLCWGAHYSAPFREQQGGILKALAD